MAAALVSVLLLYSMRLMQMQVVEGADYERQIEQGWSTTQTIKAARGEIFDRNGRPLATNTIGRNVVIDQAFMQEGSLNRVILELTKIMEAAGEDWIDNLPITDEAPFAFKAGDGYTAAIATLKSTLGLAAFATADDVVYHLKDRYDLESYEQDGEEIPYTDEEFRTIAGVRYEMERTDFSISNPYIFASDIKVETVPKIKEASYELQGVDVVESTIRQYVSGDIAPQIVGQIGKIYSDQWNAAEKGYDANGVYAIINGQKYRMDDIIGKSGAELAFEEYLKGQDGERRIVLNAQNEVVDVEEVREAVPGNTVVLTIDSRLQKVAQDALERKIISMQNDLVNYPVGEGHEADAGAVAVVDVKTGEPLVLASYPSYNLATYQQDYDELASSDPPRLLNRATQGLYTPGSIFKPVVALGSLNEGVIDPSTTVTCTGVYTRWGPGNYQPRCLDVHGNINVVDALRWSCNIFFYEAGYQLGIEGIDEYAAMLGFGQPTGIEVEEYTGRVASPEVKASLRQGEDGIWQDGDVVQAAIGQQDTKATPLQLANYAATLANNGTRMEVSLLKSVKSYTLEDTIMEHEPVVVQQIDADAAFNTIREGMVAASKIGTARAVFGEGLYPIDVASKTGTPETKEYPNSTFIAYAPADDPEIAVCVVIEKGWHGYTGAPVAKEIFDAYFFSNTGKDAAPVSYGELLA